jgi:hypothetical protein
LQLKAIWKGAILFKSFANKISIESDHVMLNDLGRIIPVKNAQEAIWTVLILLKMFSITIQFFNFENAMQRKIALLKSDA